MLFHGPPIAGQSGTIRHDVSPDDERALSEFGTHDDFPAKALNPGSSPGVASLRGALFSLGSGAWPT
jgi:hypothetical protein